MKISNSVLKKLGLMTGESKGFDDPKVMLPPSMVISCQLSSYNSSKNGLRASGETRLVNMVKKLPLVGKGEVKDRNSSYLYIREKYTEKKD